MRYTYIAYSILIYRIFSHYPIIFGKQEGLVSKRLTMFNRYSKY